MIKPQCKPMLKSQFIQEANIKHNNVYDYSKIEYVNSRTKVEILCSVHGSFWQSPAHHKNRGQGCPKCKGTKNKLRCTKTLETFIKESKIKHNNFYSYTKTVYENSNVKVIITCPIHGDFKQIPASHLLGCGCKFCALDNNGWTTKNRFSKRCKENIGIFYIIKCYNSKEVFYKLGLTSNTIQQRYSSRYHMPYSYEIIQEIKGAPNLLWDLEHTLKSFIKLKKIHYIPEIKFGGHLSECYKI